MANKKTGNFEVPIKFDGKTLDFTGKFTVAWEVTETKEYVTSVKLPEALKGFLKKRVETLMAAAQDLDEKSQEQIERAIEAKGNDMEELATLRLKVAADLHKVHKPQITSFVNGTVADGNKFVTSWWTQEQSKDKKAKGLVAKGVFKSSLAMK